MKRILALDGGGIRGVFTLQILAKIEELFRKDRNDPNLVLGDIFDLIAGTSTGAIIAAFLSWGKSVAEIERLYIEKSSQMFAAASWTDLLKSKYTAEAIKDFFIEAFKEPFTETDARLGTDYLEEKKRLLMIVMRNSSTGGLWPVTNNPEAKYNKPKWKNGKLNPNSNLYFPLWQLLRASTAAPLFFPPEEIEVAGETGTLENPATEGETLKLKKHLFMDGGMTPYNNPALIAVLTATLPCYKICWPATREQLHMISVGTGIARAKMPEKGASQVNLLDHIKYVAPALMGSIAWEQDFICRVMGDCVHGAVLDSEIGTLDAPSLFNASEQKFTYARYDEPLDATHPKIKGLPQKKLQLDNLKLISLLRELGKEYAREHVHFEHLHPRSANFKPCKCSMTKPS